jgi:hypothetical protein
MIIDHDHDHDAGCIPVVFFQHMQKEGVDCPGGAPSARSLFFYPKFPARCAGLMNKGPSALFPQAIGPRWKSPR